jgi:hypothetical protein
MYLIATAAQDISGAAPAVIFSLKQILYTSYRPYQTCIGDGVRFSLASSSVTAAIRLLTATVKWRTRSGGPRRSRECPPRRQILPRIAVTGGGTDAVVD